MQLPADAPLSDHLAVLFGQMSRAVSRDHGALTRAEYGVLSRLELTGSHRVCELAEADGPDASTVSRRVAALAERRLLERTPDPDDGRAHRVDLTQDGRTVLHTERRRRAELVSDALRDWDQTDRADLVRLLLKLSASLGERAVTTERTAA